MPIFILFVLAVAAIADSTENNELRPEWISGGEAQGRKSLDFDQRQLQIGALVEMEHVRGGEYPLHVQRSIAEEIAMDHLAEDPDYYIKLATIHSDHFGGEGKVLKSIGKGLAAPFRAIGKGVSKLKPKSGGGKKFKPLAFLKPKGGGKKLKPLGFLKTKGGRKMGRGTFEFADAVPTTQAPIATTPTLPLNRLEKRILRKTIRGNATRALARASL